MIVVDANLLLYAVDSSSPQNSAARRWLETVLAAPAPVGLPWASLLAFLRIATHRRVFLAPLTVAEARAHVDAWLALRNVRVPVPGPRHWSILAELLVDGQAKGPLVSDAHLAALTIEHGGILATTDRDFARFPGLRFENPLLA